MLCASGGTLSTWAAILACIRATTREGVTTTISALEMPTATTRPAQGSPGPASPGGCPQWAKTGPGGIKQSTGKGLQAPQQSPNPSSQAQRLFPAFLIPANPTPRPRRGCGGLSNIRASGEQLLVPGTCGGGERASAGVVKARVWRWEDGPVVRVGSKRSGGKQAEGGRTRTQRRPREDRAERGPKTLAAKTGGRRLRARSWERPEGSPPQPRGEHGPASAYAPGSWPQNRQTINSCCSAQDTDTEGGAEGRRGPSPSARTTPRA